MRKIWLCNRETAENLSRAWSPFKLYSVRLKDVETMVQGLVMGFGSIAWCWGDQRGIETNALHLGPSHVYYCLCGLWVFLRSIIFYPCSLLCLTLWLWVGLLQEAVVRPRLPQWEAGCMCGGWLLLRLSDPGETLTHTLLFLAGHSTLRK